MKKALIIVLGVAGCADILDIPDPVAAEDARCRGTIKIKMLVDLNGPTGDLGMPWFKANMDLKRETNDKGGILGCPLDIDVVDYGYNPDAARASYERWRTQSDWEATSAVFGWGSPDTLLLGSFVKEDHKPFLSGSYISEVAAPKEIMHAEDVPELLSTYVEGKFPKQFKSPGYAYNFFAGTDYSTGARVAMFYAKSAGATRIGFFRCSLSRYCTDPLDAARLQAKAQGLELGRDLVLELSGPTVTQQQFDDAVLAYFTEEKSASRPAGYKPVDWVWGGNTTTTTAMMAKAIAKANTALGMRVQLIVNNFGFNEILFQKCGQDCVGTVHGIMPHAAYGDTRAPDMATVTALHDKWRVIDGDDVTLHRNAMYVLGYVNFIMFKKAAERVIKLGKDVTGENIKDALETFNAEPMGELTAPISFTPEDHRPQGTESIYGFDSTGKLIADGSPRPIQMMDDWKGW